jgi:calcineurin-like phosphoesterase family protein
MTTFVISDNHFGHKNIIKYCNRPFFSVDEMNSYMIFQWNSVVQDDDTVIHGGDFMFYKNDTGIFNSLKGEKILVRGNHDHKATLNLGWEKVVDRLDFVHNNVNVVIDHYPLVEWNRKTHGSIHLYGHVHDTEMIEIPNSFCICVEKIGYAPVSLDNFTTKKD